MAPKPNKPAKKGVAIPPDGASGEDASAQQLAQESQQRERYYRALIERASDIITLLDAGGGILYESPSVERVLGYTPAELRSEEHTSELQSHSDLVCRLLLEK